MRTAVKAVMLGVVVFLIASGLLVELTGLFVVPEEPEENVSVEVIVINASNGSGDQNVIPVGAANRSEENKEEAESVQTESVDLCDGVACPETTVSCPDGFVARCPNACQPETGECPVCEPDCSGHDDVCSGVVCESLSAICDDGTEVLCTPVCESATGECGSCTPDCSGHEACDEQWVCDDWSACVNGTQTRICTDRNGCGTEQEKPAETQSCQEEGGAIAVRINEIMYNPLEDENYNEWVELHNPSVSAADLSGWMLCGKPLLAGFVPRCEDSSCPASDERGMSIPAQGFAIVTDGGSGTDVYGNFPVDSSAVPLHVDAGSICNRLSNEGNRTLTLADSSGNVIDEILYLGGAIEEGYSLERDGTGNWEESLTEGGTPGTRNSGGE